MEHDNWSDVESILELLWEVGMADVEVACRAALLDLAVITYPRAKHAGQRVAGGGATEGDRLATVLAVIRAAIELPMQCWTAGTDLLRRNLDLQEVSIETESLHVPDEGLNLQVPSAAITTLHDALRALWKSEPRQLRLAPDPFELGVQ